MATGSKNRAPASRRRHFRPQMVPGARQAPGTGAGRQGSGDFPGTLRVHRGREFPALFSNPNRG